MGSSGESALTKKLKQELPKRAWVYLYPPAHYEVCCSKNRKHKVEWSEFEGLIWCFDCKKDMKGFGGIFDGPIPWEVTKLMLGELCFHRLNIVKQVIEYPVHGKRKIYYRKSFSMTERYLEGQKS